MISNIEEEVRKIKKYALDNNVPIMVDESIDYLTDFIVKKQINSVLEIGTAIGYSAIMMALSNPNIKITSVERDKDRYLEAVKNIKIFNLEDRVTLIFNDAFNINLTDKFDLIFFDAAKSQNIRFFEKFEHNLNESGFIITDNISFHGLVEDDSKIVSRNVRGLVRKIKNYIDFLKNNDRYVVSFLDIGDGLSIAEKK